MLFAVSLFFCDESSKDKISFIVRMFLLNVVIDRGLMIAYFKQKLIASWLYGAIEVWLCVCVTDYMKCIWKTKTKSLLLFMAFTLTFTFTFTFKESSCFVNTTLEASKPMIAPKDAGRCESQTLTINYQLR
jgi:hypothetical protein